MQAGTDAFGFDCQLPLSEFYYLHGPPYCCALKLLHVISSCWIAAGALATLFSAALTLRHERKNWRDRFGALLTIGAPRVGNAAFAKMTQRGLRHLLDGGPEKAARLVHCNDIVPHLPPSGFSEGFVHFGRCVPNGQCGPFAESCSDCPAVYIKSYIQPAACTPASAVHALLYPSLCLSVVKLR